MDKLGPVTHTNIYLTENVLKRYKKLLSSVGLKFVGGGKTHYVVILYVHQVELGSDKKSVANEQHLGFV